MKETDLRIGNYIRGVYEDDEENECEVLCRVLALDETGEMLKHKIWVETFGANCMTEYFTNFEPITLTEEWLLKLGFNKDNEIEFHIHSKNNHLIYIYFEKLRDCYAMIYNGSQFTEVKYVHQLQNLYFAITGKELIHPFTHSLIHSL